MKIGIVLHPKKKKTEKIILLLFKFLLSKGQELFIPEDMDDGFYENEGLNLIPRKEMAAKIDIMFSIGGDGTFIGGARLVSGTKIPVFGIHLGGLGFLADITVDNYKERLTDFLNGNYEIEERSVLEAIIKRKDKIEKYYAYNELLISRGNIMGMTKIRTYVDGEYLNTYRGDGVLVATPTGSTAYSLSAGGPIISPDLNIFVISPICPHSLSARPLIISDKQTVSFDCGSIPQKVVMVVDGQKRITLDKATKLKFKKANFPLRIIRFKNDSFFQTLQSKLKWGIDNREK